MNPRCDRCKKVMTPENAKLRPELFMCDACSPPDLRSICVRCGATGSCDCNVKVADLVNQLRAWLSIFDGAEHENELVQNAIDGTKKLLAKCSHEEPTLAYGRCIMCSQTATLYGSVCRKCHERDGTVTFFDEGEPRPWKNAE